MFVPQANLLNGTNSKWVKCPERKSPVCTIAILEGALFMVTTLYSLLSYWTPRISLDSLASCLPVDLTYVMHL